MSKPDDIQKSWKSLANALHAGVVVLSQDGHILFANKQAATIFRKNQSELIGEVFSLPYRQQGQQEIEIPFYDEKKNVIAEMTVDKGAWAGKPAWIVTLHDITERKTMEAKLRIDAKVFTCAHEGILITDKEGVIQSVNQAMLELTGYTEAEIINQKANILRSGIQTAAFYKDMYKQLNEQGFWQGEIINKHKDDSLHPMFLSISTIEDDFGDVTHYASTMYDLTKLKEQQQKIEYIAQYDEMTDLPNHILLLDRIKQAMASSKRQNSHFILAYIDLDDLNTINEQYGRKIGDKYLSKLAKRYKTVIPQGDTIARISGDDFVAVFNDVSNNDKDFLVINQMIDMMSRPIYINGKEIKVSASIGITEFPQEASVDAEQLIRQASQAMTKAKTFGKNQVVFFDLQSEKKEISRHQRLKEIKQALHKNEFRLHYQPKVNMKTGEIIGLEALLRWQHPEHGLLLPGSFLPILTSDPLAISVNEWVLEHVFEQMSQWQADHRFLNVSINMSAEHILSNHFIPYLKKLFKQYNHISPECIELELLESSEIAEFKKTANVIQQCRQIGVDFAFDDFGTGYSSLTYLKQLPITTLKIDQSFILNLFNNPKDILILESIFNLSKSFHLKVIAEGIETLEHGLLLTQLGCVYGQGFAIARPMPASDLLNWIDNWELPQMWARKKTVPVQFIELVYMLVEAKAWKNKFKEKDIHFIQPGTLPERLDNWLHKKGQIFLEGQSARQELLQKLQEELSHSIKNIETDENSKNTAWLSLQTQLTKLIKILESIIDESLDNKKVKSSNN